MPQTRSHLIILALLGAGNLSVALAEPPAAPSPAPAAAAPATSVSSTTPEVNPPASPAAASPNAESVKSTSADAAQTAEEAELRVAGYRPEMRNGTKIWCRREIETGSHLIAQKVCGTSDQIKLGVQRNQDNTRAVQKLYNQTLK